MSAFGSKADMENPHRGVGNFVELLT